MEDRRVWGEGGEEKSWGDGGGVFFGGWLR